MSTLAFNYPSRANFFRKELENFLLMTREQKLDPLSVHGSYAGAIGMPQFMPSSYRAYAVDFSGKSCTKPIKNWSNDIYPTFWIVIKSSPTLSYGSDG